MIDSLMVHSVSGSVLNNAAKYSHNTLQGHHHSVFQIAYYSDMQKMRWAMGVGCLMDGESVAARYGRGLVLKRPILGCGVINNGSQNMLVISDLHIPYQHPDAFDFLDAVRRKYKTPIILNVGDVLDHHQGSYHESEPDAMYPEQEYRAAKKDAQLLQEIFPRMVITAGNHDKIPTRKLKSANLPSSMLSDYNELYELKDTWKWLDEYKFDSFGGIPHLVPMVLNKRNRWDKVVN